ncbi:universal stress protein [Citricoccus sp. SGAir0253]|uniref:universal stress protein n=1 Tax=Citricoccus sp. SGAir0253 TaxID=2567881 RepID=UPI0010CCB486|nr:universal stress protein [Citricoccus sp. SGAir0253]QCU78950.1 universal stress protein [Citricoccus sp. SGAir0253]
MDAVKPVVVGVDGSEASLHALREGARMARLTEAPLTVVTAWQWPMLVVPEILADRAWSPHEEAERLAADAVRKALGEETPPGTTVVAREGPAALVLTRMSREASMLVVGSRGRGGFAGLVLGSVSSAVGGHARCPVLITHHSGHEAAQES